MPQVDLAGLEPATFAVRRQRAPNCATGPRLTTLPGPETNYQRLSRVRRCRTGSKLRRSAAGLRQRPPPTYRAGVLFGRLGQSRPGVLPPSPRQPGGPGRGRTGDLCHAEATRSHCATGPQEGGSRSRRPDDCSNVQPTSPDVSSLRSLVYHPCCCTCSRTWRLTSRCEFPSSRSASACPSGGQATYLAMPHFICQRDTSNRTMRHLKVAPTRRLHRESSLSCRALLAARPAYPATRFPAC